MKVIDATNLILGRFCAKVAKAALQGEEIVIVNCEKAIVVGKPSEVFTRYKRKSDIGTTIKGPFYHRHADRIVRRTIRGMVGHKTQRGSEAYKRVMCYMGVPIKYMDQKLETLPFNINDTANTKFVTVGDISKHIGGA